VSRESYDAVVLETLILIEGSATSCVSVSCESSALQCVQGTFLEKKNEEINRLDSEDGTELRRR
jgi:hypothetical protein